MLLLIFSTDVNYYRHYWDSDINYPIHFSRLSCFGSEYRVTDCQYNNNTVGYSHVNDWGVTCSVGEHYLSLDVQL